MFEQVLQVPKGIIVPLTTPFKQKTNSSYAADLNSVKKVTDYVIDEQGHSKTPLCQGVFPLGTTGEFWLLNPEEQLKVIDAVVSETNGRVPVLAGVTQIADNEKPTLEQIARINRMKENKPDFLVVQPLVFHSNRGLRYLFQKIKDSTDIPVVAYNFLGVIESLMKWGIIKRTFKKENTQPERLREISSYISAFKDSSGDLSLFGKYLYSVAGTPVLGFLGDESKFYETFLTYKFNNNFGGGVLGIGNAAPWIIARLYNSIFDGDIGDMKTIQIEINKINKGYRASGNIPAVLKTVQGRRGLCEPVYSGNRVFGVEDIARKTLEIAGISRCYLEAAHSHE